MTDLAPGGHIESKASGGNKTSGPSVPPHPMRRSTRVSWRVHVRLTGIDRDQPFAVDCETLVVNLHGCALQSPRSLPGGTPIQLEVSGKTLSGRVKDVVDLAAEQPGRWMLGIALEQAGNHWGIQYPPEDWGAPPQSAPQPVASELPKRPTQSMTRPSPGSAPAKHSEPKAAPPLAVPSRMPEAAGRPATVVSAPAQRQPQPERAQPAPAVPKAPPPPPPPAQDALIQEIRAQLAQLQQAQAKQETMLLQQRTEKQAAREAAEKTMAEQMERMRQTKDYVESLVCSFRAVVETQVQEHAQAIVRRLQPQASRADLEKQREGQQTAEAALEQRAAQLIGELRRQLEQTFQQQHQAAEAAHAAAAAQLRELEQRADQITSLVDVELQKHAEQIVSETVAEIKNEIQQAGAALRQPQTAQALNDAAPATLRRQAEDIQTSVLREAEQLQQSVHDAFIEAGGEIRGRIAQAVETAAAPIEQCSLALQEQMAALAQQHVQELHRLSDAVCGRLASCSQESQTQIAAALQARISEALDGFSRDAQRLAQSSIERWQAAVAQTLVDIPKLLANYFAAQTGATLNPHK